MPRICWTALVLALITLLLRSSTCAAAAPASRFTVAPPWTPQEGLPQSSVFAVTQTRDGYLWLGTGGGLARFDGLRFKTFDDSNTPQLGNAKAVKLFEDSRTNLWIATDTSGVFVVDPNGHLARQELGDPSREGPAVTISEDSRGSVWLRMSQGQIYRVLDGHSARLCRRVSGDRVDIFLDYSGSQPWLRSAALAADNEGLIWVAAESVLAGYKVPDQANTNLSLQFEHYETNIVGFEYLLPSRNGGCWAFVQALMVDGNGNVRRTGLVERRKPDGTVGYYFADPWPQDIPILSVCEDQYGSPVVGTYGDYVWWFDPSGSATHITGLSHGSVYSVTLDREGDLWVGTNGKGLNRVRRALFQALEPSLGLAIKSVSADSEGGIWYGVDKGGVRHLAGAGVENFLSNYTVRSVLVDSTHQVWVGTEAGELFRSKAGSLVPFAALRLQDINVVYRDAQGRLWVGANAGLACWTSEWRVRTTRDGLAGNKVHAIAQDRAGVVWIGTDQGLSRWDERQFTNFSKTNGLPGEDVHSVYVDSDNVVWAGTSGGLGRFAAGVWTTFSKEEGLVNNSVSYILEDTKGYLWLGSTAGLMRVDKAALTAYAAHPTNTVLVRAYDANDGLPSGECTQDSQPAACIGADGRLWFATIAGLAAVNPALLSHNTNPPPVQIEAVRLDGKVMNPQGLRAPLPGQITIPAGTESLEIDFTTLNLAAPEKGRFAYKLEGYERNWTEKPGTVRSARYSNLSPGFLSSGHFTFRVKACNEDWVWNEQGVALAVEVLPPFWRTWWFVSGMSVIALALIVGSVHLVSTQRLQRQVERLRHQEAVEKERARIARDLHDQLGANLTQVALLGELAEADKESPQEVESHARQICQTARETTHALDEIVWTVNPSNDTLDGLINYVCKYAQEYFAIAGLRYRLEVPPQLPNTPVSPELRHNLFLAAKESINNVVKHAGADSTWIRLELHADKFVLEIEDNGRGISPADREKGRSGLRNLQKRMQDVGGEFEIISREGGGTIVRLTAPLRIAIG